MDTRRLPFVLLLVVLLPVPAQAHRHKWESMAGLSTGSVSARFSLAGRLWPSPFDSAAKGDVTKSLFLFLEGADKLSRDSGHALDDKAIGLRYRLDGERTGWFVHGMVGKQSPPRPEGNDTATASSTAAGVGAGVDYTLKQDRLTWLVRFQGDAGGSWPSSGFDSHVRATIGFVVRWEGGH